MSSNSSQINNKHLRSFVFALKAFVFFAKLSRERKRFCKWTQSFLGEHKTYVRKNFIAIIFLTFTGSVHTGNWLIDWLMVTL